MGRTRGTTLLSPADPNKTISVTIAVRRNPYAVQHREATASAEIVSRGNFAAQYGASQADLDLVADFARSHGMNILEISGAKRIVKVSGTVQQMNDAFDVKLGYYESPTGSYLGREGKIFLPQAVANVVEGIFGLDNRRMASRRSNRPSRTSPQTAK